jgi:hypothetical protein
MHHSEGANNQTFFCLILSSAISSIRLPKMEPHFFGFKKFVFAVSNSKIIIDNEIDFIKNDFNPSEPSKSKFFGSEESRMERRKQKEWSHGEISDEKLKNHRLMI